MSCCHTNLSGVHSAVCVVCSSSAIENNYSDIFYKTTESTAPKFHMEHDLTPGSQNCKTGPG